MPRSASETRAVRVYTVCDESRYLIVRNVPALGCADELVKLFGSYGDIEEFAKRKLDEYVFLGNRIQVSYAPHFESLSDTKEKLEGRRKEVLGRINSGKPKWPKPPVSTSSDPHTFGGPLLIQGSSQAHCSSGQINSEERECTELARTHDSKDPHDTSMAYNQYFSSPSMNETVRLVRERLDKIQSSGGPHEHIEAGPASKKSRVDNRRRI